jgi:hypothetical protein
VARKSSGQVKAKGAKDKLKGRIKEAPALSVVTGERRPRDAPTREGASPKRRRAI